MTTKEDSTKIGEYFCQRDLKKDPQIRLLKRIKIEEGKEEEDMKKKYENTFYVVDNELWEENKIDFAHKQLCTHEHVFSLPKKIK